MVYDTDVTARAIINGARADVSTLRYETSRLNEAAVIEVETPDVDINASVGDTLRAFINNTLIGTLTVGEFKPTGENTTRIRAFDAIKDLKTFTLTQKFNDASPIAILQRVSSGSGVEIGAAPAVGNSTISPNFANAKGDQVVDTVAKLINGVWYITPENQLAVQQTPDTTQYGLPYVKPETDAGLKTPPYTQVTVVGTSSQSAGARATSRAKWFIASQPPIATVGDEDGKQFLKRVSEAKTDAQARNYAKSLLNEFQKQRAEGAIVSLGDERLRPLDVVNPVNIADDANFIITKLVHRVNNGEGFLTDITPGAVVSGN
jgi:hypothetical protein